MKAADAKAGMRVARSSGWGFGKKYPKLTMYRRPQVGIISHDPSTIDLWANRIPIKLDGAKRYRLFHAIEWEVITS